MSEHKYAMHTYYSKLHKNYLFNLGISPQKTYVPLRLDW